MYTLEEKRCKFLIVDETLPGALPLPAGAPGGRGGGEEEGEAALHWGTDHHSHSDTQVTAMLCSIIIITIMGIILITMMGIIMIFITMVTMLPPDQWSGRLT